MSLELSWTGIVPIIEQGPQREHGLLGATEQMLVETTTLVRGATFGVPAVTAAMYARAIDVSGLSGIVSPTLQAGLSEYSRYIATSTEVISATLSLVLLAAMLYDAYQIGRAWHIPDQVRARAGQITSALHKNPQS